MRQNFFLLFIFFNGFLSSPGQNKKVIDSLESLLSTASNPKLQADLLGKISEEYRYNDAEKEFQFAKSQFVLAQKIHYEKGLAEAFLRYGYFYSFIGNTDSSIYYCNKSIETCNKIGDLNLKGFALSRLSSNLVSKGMAEEALKNSLEALKIFESTHDSSGLGIALSTVPNCSPSMPKEKILEYYLGSLKIFMLKKDFKTAARITNNIGCVYLDGNSLDTAMNYFNQSLALASENKFVRALCYNNIGIILSTRGEKNQKKVFQYYLDALNLLKEIKADKVKHAYSTLGSYCVSIGDFEKAKKYSDTLLLMAKKTNDKIYMSWAYSNLSDINAAQNIFSEAFKFSKKYSILQDSLFREEKNKQLTEMEAKYQNEKKQKEISLLQKDNEIKDLTLIKRNAQLFLLASGILVTIILGFLLYQWKHLREKQKFNSEMMRQQEIRLKAILETQEEERNRISRDLHDGVGQLLSGLKFSAQNLLLEYKDSPPYLSEKLKRQTNILDEAAIEVRTIAHQMMPRALKDAGVIPAIENLLSKAFEKSGINYEFEHSKVVGMRFTEAIEISLYRIVQELINNIIKHSSASNVNVQLYKNLKDLILVVEDNGIGFDPSDFSGHGHGLMNIMSRVKLINGEVNFQRSHPIGMMVVVKVPVG